MTVVFDPDTERFVSEKHKNIATIIHDYNPELQLVWIPPENRTEQEEREYPFAVVHTPAVGPNYIVMLLRENEVDQRVLERLFLADQSKNDPKSQVMASNAAAKLVEEYEHAQRMEELAEFHAALIKSPKHTYRHNGRVYHQ